MELNEFKLVHKHFLMAGERVWPLSLFINTFIHTEMYESVDPQNIFGSKGSRTLLASRGLQGLPAGWIVLLWPQWSWIEACHWPYLAHRMGLGTPVNWSDWLFQKHQIDTKFMEVTTIGSLNMEHDDKSVN